MNIPNLVRLIAYLREYDAAVTKPHGLGFNGFASHNDSEIGYPVFAQEWKGSTHLEWVLDPVGCAASLGILPTTYCTTWWDYCKEALLPVPIGNRAPFDWCFGIMWHQADPTALGCAKRIAWLLSRESEGLPPMAFRDRRTQYNPDAWFPTYEGLDIDEILEKEKLV